MRRCNERIKLYQSKYDEISDIAGIAKEKRRMSVTKSEKDLTFDKKQGIIKSREVNKTEIIKPDLVLDGHKGTSKSADPNIVIDHKDKDGKVDIRTFYGDDGYKKKDIHTTDYGHPKQHPYGEHGENAEDYIWDENGKLKHKNRR